MGILRLLPLLCAFVTSLAWAGAPEPVMPTEAEWSKVVTGAVVSRNAPELSPPGAYAWVEVKASSDKIWDVINDPAEAAAASGAVESVDKYLDEKGPEGRRIGLHYVLNVAWTEVSYHVLRDFRRDQGFMTWTLDPSKKSDLVHTSGSYVIKEGRTPGTVLLIYATQTDSGRNVPTWVTNMLTGRALKGYLGHVKTIAER